LAPDEVAPSFSGRRLHRRLATLRTLEWVNIGWLAVILLWVLPVQREVDLLSHTWQRTLAFVPVAGMLLVGGWYWHRKLHQRRDGRPLDDVLPILDRLDRWVPSVLLGSAVAVVLSWTFGVGSTTDRAWATGLVVFAWLEYINYFRVQLMHDTRSDLRRLARTRRLRPSWLATDLRQYRQRAHH
jgi:hypothetical protein